jgi:hypothetical protein
MMPPDKEAPRSGSTHPAGDATTNATPVLTKTKTRTSQISSAARQPYTDAAQPVGTVMPVVASQQVNWWAVHEFVAPMLAQVGSCPTVGTPAWCALRDDDPVKIAGIFDAARHWALRVETCQQERAQASRDISAAANWSAVATRILQPRDEAYIPREVAS